MRSSARIIPEYLWYRQGITWSRVGTALFGFRLLPTGTTFDKVGSSIFVQGDDCQLNLLLGILNTTVAQTLLEMLNPSVDLQVKDVRNIPVAENLDTNAINAIVQKAISLSKRDWDSFENSLAYRVSPLLSNENKILEKAASQLRDERRRMVDEIESCELDLNSQIAAAYDFPKPLVSRGDVSLTCNPHYRYDDDKSESELEALLLADTMREFISYAVGCMLGRYSLDKPGLILANQGDTLREYFRLTISDFGLKGEYDDSRLDECLQACTFAPDDDNVIPMLDGDWFTDDISERFKTFLKITFGTEHYAENLQFLEDAIYPDNTTARKRKTIRDYFLKDFYNHHVKLYKKRPIYWLFSSPKGTFNALIYMHRYRSDTVSSVLQYLRDFRDKLAHHRDHQQMVADSGGSTAAEKTKALKEVTAIKKQLKELEDYERDTLFPLAQQKIEIDLDDGVKHNYPLFGTALKKVTRLS